MTLLEIIISLGILAGSLAIIANLSRMSTDSAVMARNTTQAQLLCESIMARLMSGVIEFESVFDVPVYDPVHDFDYTAGASYSNYSNINDDYKWTYSIEINSIDDYGLLEVIVTVSQYLPQNTTRNPVSCELVRWMLDIATAKEVLEAEAASSENSETESSTGSTNTGNTGSNNSGGGNPGGQGTGN